jgi:hypothetical protein
MFMTHEAAGDRVCLEAYRLSLLCAKEWKGFEIGDVRRCDPGEDALCCHRGFRGVLSREVCYACVPWGVKGSKGVRVGCRSRDPNNLCEMAVQERQVRDLICIESRRICHNADIP